MKPRSLGSPSNHVGGLVLSLACILSFCLQPLLRSQSRRLHEIAAIGHALAPPSSASTRCASFPVPVVSPLRLLLALLRLERFHTFKPKDASQPAFPTTLGSHPTVPTGILGGSIWSVAMKTPSITIDPEFTVEPRSSLAHARRRTRCSITWKPAIPWRCFSMTFPLSVGIRPSPCSRRRGRDSWQMRILRENRFRMTPPR
jgi:hypothetical protein